MINTPCTVAASVQGTRIVLRVPVRTDGEWHEHYIGMDGPVALRLLTELAQSIQMVGGLARPLSETDKGQVKSDPPLAGFDFKHLLVQGPYHSFTAHVVYWRGISVATSFGTFTYDPTLKKMICDHDARFQVNPVPSTKPVEQKENDPDADIRIRFRGQVRMSTEAPPCPKCGGEMRHITDEMQSVWLKCQSCQFEDKLSRVEERS